MNAVTTVEDDPREVAPPQSPSQSLLALMAPGSINDVNALRALIEVQREERAIEAEQAYNAAMSKARADFDPIAKRAQADKFRYADMADVQDAVKSALDTYGFHVKYEWTTTEAGVVCTCVIKHAAGHVDRTSLPPAPHWEGVTSREGKRVTNQLQNFGGTLTYLERMSLMSALGLAATEDPDRRPNARRDEYDLPKALDAIRAAETREQLKRLQSEINAGQGEELGRFPPNMRGALIDAWRARVAEFGDGDTE